MGKSGLTEGIQDKSFVEPVDSPDSLKLAGELTIRKYEMETLIFDMDDTLVVEEASAEAALMATCQVASHGVSVDAVQLCRSIRENLGMKLK